MKITKTASGKQTINISKKEWTSIGKKAGWIKAASEFQEYYLDNGKIIDQDGNDLTDKMFVLNAMMKVDYAALGIDYNGKGMPRFKTEEQANKFIEAIEKISKRKLGRVAEDLRKKLKYKDTYKDRQLEKEKEMIERNKRFQKDLSYEDPNDVLRKKHEVDEFNLREVSKNIGE